MATPSTMSSRSAGSREVSAGERFNKLPLVIVGFIVVLFAFGLYYAAISRVQEPELAGGVADTFEGNGAGQDYDVIDFTQGRSDGLVNATAPDDSNTENKDESTDGDDMADQLGHMIEKQRMEEFERNSKMQTQLLQHQLDQAQAALDGDVSVNMFDRGTLDGRPQSPEQATPSIANALSGNSGPFNSVNQNGQNRTSDGRSNALSNSQAASSSSTDISGVVASKDFVSGDYRNDFTLNETVRSPSSKFQLMTGALIPGVMISAANSELPGDLIAQVTQDVYDSVTGRYLLIPQGSKIFGRYDAFAALGSERLLMVWDRIIYPDGEAITIGSIQGYDDRGMAGAKDIVITHFWRTLFNALLLSVVDSTGDLLTDESTQGTGIIADISANFGSTTSGAFNDYLQDRLKIKPTFEIRSGYRFNIIVNRDITFPEPFEFGYTRLEIR